MQVNTDYRDNFSSESEDVFFSLESQEEVVNEIVIEEKTNEINLIVTEAFKQIVPEIKKAITEAIDEKVDLYASSLTDPCTKLIREKSPTLAIIINPIIETSAKKTSKKVGNSAVDKCINKTEKSLPFAIDYGSKSTQSFFGRYLTVSPVVENEKIKEII